MEFFYLVKASQKSGKKDAVIWFTAKSAARANLQLDVALEDAEIETGRGKDYAKPIRTDMPIVDDLPAEGVIDYTWFERYTLADDQRTWNVIPGAAQQPHSGEKVLEGTGTTIVDGVDIETCEIVGDVSGTETVCNALREFRERKLPVLTTVATMPFRQRVLAQFIADKQYFYHVDEEQKRAILELELDVDNSYAQNLILAAENVEAFKKAYESDIWKVVNALKTIFPVEGKRIELSVIIQFFKAWFNTESIDRGILTREWAAGNRISHVQRTDAGTNADGGYVTDRGADAHHTLDTLDLEIACALLPMDFHHFEIPSSVLRRAKEIVATKEEPWKSWSKILRNQPGVLSVNRAAIFNLVRIAPENIHLTPAAHLEFVNRTMTAEFNAAVELLPLPAPVEPEIDSQFVDEQLAADRGEYVEGISDPDDPKWVKEDLTTTSQPQVANLGGGMYSIEGLMNEKQPQNDDRSPVTEETTSDVQMETTDPAEGEAGNPVQPGESADATDTQTDALNPTEVLAAAAPTLASQDEADVNQKTKNAHQNDDSAHQNAPKVNQSEPKAQQPEPAVEYQAYFEPGRYEGLPNNVYHAANGISSTQVKDARVSLMFYHGRHVAKTIPREGSKVLDMGNLVHALALQPENLDEEFSVEPVIPEGAFTTAATLRAFIDEPQSELRGHGDDGHAPPAIFIRAGRLILKYHRAT